MKPRVSILTPCLDAEETLSTTIASVLAQTIGDWELLIADDGSRDDSYAIATGAAASDMRIRVLPPPHQHSGAGAARNRALAVARGRYIAFLDADDMWLPEKLSHQLAAMEKTSVPFSCTGFILQRAGYADRILVPPERQTRQDLLTGNRIGCLTAMYDTAHFGKVPMPEMRRRQDYALWLDLLTRTEHVLGLPEPLAIHIRRPGSLSANPALATLGTWRVLRHHAGLPAGVALQALARHLIQRIFRETKHNQD